MRRPTLRYPLFWILGLLGGALIVALARPAIVVGLARVERTWKRALEGPPVPASTTPRQLADGVPRRALLLHEATPVTDVPGGNVVETLGHRMWLDVYDTWPVRASSPTTHVRVGNRRPFGWVAAADLLAWDTRLVVAPRTGSIDLADQPGGTPRVCAVPPGGPLPVIGWQGDTWLQVAVWSPDSPWQRVETRGWVQLGAVDPDLSPGVLLSRPELLVLLRQLIQENSAPDPLDRWYRAVTGRLLDRQPVSPAQIDALRVVLPAWSLPPASGQRPPQQRLESLTRLNENWTPQVQWSGLEFRVLPLDEL